MRELPHRMLVLDGDEHGVHFGTEARAAGWTVERYVAMVALRAPDDPDDPRRRQPTREVDPDALAELRRESALEQGLDEDTVRTGAVVDRALAAVAGTRDFASFADGRPVAAASLLSDPDRRVGQIEDVGTLRGHRGRGHARSVVLAALIASRQAGHELTFLWADEEDWPRELYAKLGFDVVGRRWRARRVLAP